MLSLFSGAGGLDLGLEAAGFSTLACVELDKTARETLAHNRPQWATNLHTDVVVAANELAPKHLGLRRRQLDLIAGGPPCQPFSKAAQWNPSARRGIDDPRAQQPIHATLQLIDTFLPRAVLFENVAGFLHGERNARATLAEGFAAINAKHGTRYSIQSEVLNAADYGVPQNRLRAIVVARRDGVPFKFPEPTHDDEPRTAWDALWDLAPVPLEVATGKWTRLLPAVPEGMNYLHLTARGGGPELFGWRTRYWSFLLKLAKDRPAWTLPASPGPNTGPFHWDNRPLTVRERLRLQSFPDTWELTGSEKAKVRMSGNATPPALAEVIGRELLRQLRLGQADWRREKLRTQPALIPMRAAMPGVPRAVTGIPTDFLELVGQKQSHPGAGQGPSPRASKAAA